MTIEGRIRALSDDQLLFAQIDCYSRMSFVDGERRRQLRHLLAVVLVERRRRQWANR